MSRLVFVAAVLLGAGCYNPDPQDGSFSCSQDAGGYCPSGFVCSPQNLCVHTTVHDMGGGVLDLATDLATGPVVRTCDQRVAEGAFSNLTPLSNANTASDEAHLAFDPTNGKRLLFVRDNVLYAAAFNNTKSLKTPVAVTLAGAPSGATLLGGSITTDGAYWFAATDGGTTSIYSGARTDASTFTISTAPHAPTASSCPFSDPVFAVSSSKSDLFISYALAGCSGPSYVVRGALDRNLGAFYSAISDNGWASPSISQDALQLIVSTTTTGSRHLYSAIRPDVNTQFNSAGRIPMSAIGEAIEDRQAVVSNDCSTIYFSSVRTGGAGGADLYAADIAAE